MKTLREYITLIDESEYIDVYEESATDLWNELPQERRKILEDTYNIDQIKGIIKNQKEGADIKLTSSDIGKTYCAISFYFMPVLPVIKTKNSGNAVLYKIDDNTYYFRNNTSHFKFPDDQVNENQCYYRIVCSDSVTADHVLSTIRLALPNPWKLKG